MELIQNKIYSSYLNREVDLSIFQVKDEIPDHVIIINDGQDLAQMHIEKLLHHFNIKYDFKPLIVGCSAAPGEERKQEYGVQWAADYKGRGAKAGSYASFITEELIPDIKNKHKVDHAQFTMAGWSLGGLSAVDIAWHAPHIFQKVGMFSGSLWWRNHNLIKDDVHHRLMHHKVKNTTYKPGLKFWFQAGTEDESADRNKNGIIDVIDDTLDLIYELETKGYHKDQDFHFHIEEGGKHDVPTWSKMMYNFLDWHCTN